MTSNPQPNPSLNARNYKRCFVGVMLSESTQEKIFTILNPLREDFSDLKWSRPSNLHVTLRYMDTLSHAQARSVQAIVETLNPTLTCRSQTILRLGGVQRKVLCLGVQSETLSLSAQRLDQALETMAEVRPRKHEPFQAHVTLCRIAAIDTRLPILLMRLQQILPFEIELKKPQLLTRFEGAQPLYQDWRTKVSHRISVV